MLSRLQAMSLAEARLAVARKEFGDPPDSPNYLFASGFSQQGKQLSVMLGKKQLCQLLKAPWKSPHLSVTTHAAQTASQQSQ